MGNIGNITKPFNRFIYCFYEGKLSDCLLKFMFEFAPANCENYSVILKKKLMSGFVCILIRVCAILYNSYRGLNISNNNTYPKTSDTSPYLS